MKALSLWQPWSTLVAIGAKRYETRSWRTDYRGPLAIHATAKWDDQTFDDLVESQDIEWQLCREVLVKAGVSTSWKVPLGAIIALVDLVDCHRVERIRDQLSFQEQAFGNYEPGRYAWELANVRPIEPLRASGKQGLWEWDETASGLSVPAVQQGSLF